MKLQQEVGSECPFCHCYEVSIFEVHHIDENSENSSFNNLILICPNCHQKITDKEIPKHDVIDLKLKLMFGNLNKVELANTNVDSTNCNWVPRGKDNCF
ncbi:MAG TPA: HNH endonuclease signature motif containing protein, partial [Cytophagaceae bacterium]